MAGITVELLLVVLICVEIIRLLVDLMVWWETSNRIKKARLGFHTRVRDFKLSLRRMFSKG